jgi:hypothetical protein
MNGPEGSSFRIESAGFERVLDHGVTGRDLRCKAANVFELKPISADAIPVDLAKAERYRLINEPAQAESICQDILQIDPNNQQALVMLVLSLTDQMESKATARQAQEWLSRLHGEYERNYYAGIIAERLGRAYIRQQRHGFGFQASNVFEKLWCISKGRKSCNRPAMMMRSSGGTPVPGR